MRISPLDFLLECIGFPPDFDQDALVDQVRREGGPVAWRGDPENHLALDLGEGLELRADRQDEDDFWTLLPHYQVPHRLRLSVESFARVPDSPFDALLVGWAAPPTPAEIGRYGGAPGAYRLATWLTDARRVPARLDPGHVLAISVAGFALDVTYIGPNAGVSHAGILERPRGAYVSPVGDADSPGGCSDLSLRVISTKRMHNRLTGETVELCVCDAPERPLLIFLSPWQLRRDGLPSPRPGWRIEGTFLFTGRVAGGLRRKRPRAFG
ncbi:MAG: hypothetical protein ACI9HE_000425 [Planctomycetota bacterium]